MSTEAEPPLRTHFGTSVMRILAPVVLSILCAACGAGEGDGEAIGTNRGMDTIFESQEGYSTHTLDRAAIDRFLSANPGSRKDSADIHAFYERRRYQFAWLVNDSLSQAAMAFASLVQNTDQAYRPVAELTARLNELLIEARKGPDREDHSREDLELTMTAAFFHFADRKYGGMVGRDLHELDWYIPRSKKNYDRLIDSIIAGRMDLRAIEPLHPQYGKLKEWIRRYAELDSTVNWVQLSLGELRKIEPGGQAEIIPWIRERLALLGDLRGAGGPIAPEPTLYDSTLVAAVKHFQARHCLAVDGVIGGSVVRALNITPAQRIRTILVNMERLRWVPEQPSPDMILVNIPEFRMHVVENGKEAWSMKVVVGKAATRTVIFSDTLSTIVFSPYWSVPQSIVRQEILPALKRNPNYLSRKGMERVGGTSANPVIRQKPGPGNALGRVKFLFPNSYSIYFHDTPAKEVFARESRAFSHGCIRLDEPERLAAYLLRSDTSWNTGSIRAAMAAGIETWVPLKEKRPVTIGYFTAWVGDDDLLYFCDDVYGYDEKLAGELFFDRTPPPPVAPDTMVMATAP